MKQSVNLSAAKTSTSSQVVHKLTSPSLSLSNPSANIRPHAGFFQNISNAKSFQTGLSVFFFVMGIAIMAKVFHHF